LKTVVGGEAKGSTPDEMKALVSSEIAKWKAVVERARISRIDR
jgi:hypothetical protein